MPTDDFAFDQPAHEPFTTILNGGRVLELSDALFGHQKSPVLATGLEKAFRYLSAVKPAKTGDST